VTSIARWLSIVFHPFVTVAVMAAGAAAARQSQAAAVRSIALHYL
jgi:hypothetical protein